MSDLRVILAWSPTDVDSWRPGDAIVPLSAAAHTATFRLPPTAVLNARTYLSGPPAVADCANALLNVLHGDLTSCALPWLEAYANVGLHIKVFQILAWLRLIRALRTEFPA